MRFNPQSNHWPEEPSGPLSLFSVGQLSHSFTYLLVPQLSVTGSFRVRQACRLPIGALPEGAGGRTRCPELSRRDLARCKRIVRRRSLEARRSDGSCPSVCRLG